MNMIYGISYAGSANVFLRSIRKPESCEDTINVSFSLQNQWIIRTSFVDKRNSATLVRMPKC